MWKRILWPLINALLVAVLLSACGFHLRGSQRVTAMQPVIFVEADAKSISPFIVQELTNHLEVNGDDAAGKATVGLIKGVFNKRVIVLDDRAHPAEQMLILYLDYSLTLDDKNPVQESLTTELNYFFNSQSLISADQYEIELKKRLLQKAADQIRGKLRTLMFQ